MQMSFLIYQPKPAVGWLYQNAPPRCSDGFIITGKPRSLRYCASLWDFHWNTITAFHLFSFFWSFSFPPGTLCWSLMFIMKLVYIFLRAIPAMCCICFLSSHTTTCTPTLTNSRRCGHVFRTWSKLGLSTQPSHLLRKKVPFQSRNATSTFLVPSGKNKHWSRVNLLSLSTQDEVPAYCTWEHGICTCSFPVSWLRCIKKKSASPTNLFLPWK